MPFEFACSHWRLRIIGFVWISFWIGKLIIWISLKTGRDCGAAPEDLRLFQRLTLNASSKHRNKIYDHPANDHHRTKSKNRQQKTITHVGPYRIRWGCLLFFRVVFFHGIANKENIWPIWYMTWQRFVSVCVHVLVPSDDLTIFSFAVPSEHVRFRAFVILQPQPAPESEHTPILCMYEKHK